MSAYRKIMMTTDLSDESFGALEHAKTMARQFDAELIVLCVVVDPVHFTMGELYTAGGMFTDLGQVREDAQARALSEIEKRLAGEDLPHRVHVVTGNYPPKCILDEARTLGAELIVMATHGRTGLGHVLLGSTAERVVQKSEIPVLTVRARSEKKAP